MIFSKKTILPIFFLVLMMIGTNVLYAQHNDFNIDAFFAGVDKLSSDTEKVKFIIERATTMGCEDSTYRLLLVKQARSRAEKINWIKGIIEADWLLADVYIECKKQYQTGFDLLQKTAVFAEKNGHLLDQAHTLEKMAKKYGKLNQHDKAIEYFSSALLLKSGIDMEIGILADIGHAYSDINDYPNSIIYYDSSLKLIEKRVIGKSSDKLDTTVRIGMQINMANIYLAMPDADKALQNFQQVYAISTFIQNARFIGLSLIGMGRTYKLLKQYSKAIGYFQRGLIVSITRNRFEDEIVIFNEIANTYLDSGEYKIAKNYADSALSLAEGQQYIISLSKTNATIGNVYLKQNEPKQAAFYLQKALDYSLQTHKLEDQKVAWMGLTTAFKMGGQYDKALDAYEHFINVRDSTRKIERTNEAIRLDLKNSNRTERLKQEDEYSKKIQRVKFFTYGGYGGLAFVILLAFFIYRNYKTQRKYNALLSKEQKSNLAHIEAQSHVLSDIAHIQAHEVRGPVSAIMGFVEIFNYDDPADPQNVEIMEWIGVSAEKLDTVVRSVVFIENNLRSEHEKDVKKG
jgi:tetratricopeptide (TPR) repeat protein